MNIFNPYPYESYHKKRIWDVFKRYHNVQILVGHPVPIYYVKYVSLYVVKIYCAIGTVKLKKNLTRTKIISILAPKSKDRNIFDDIHQDFLSTILSSREIVLNGGKKANFLKTIEILYTV